MICEGLIENRRRVRLELGTWGNNNWLSRFGRALCRLQGEAKRRSARRRRSHLVPQGTTGHCPPASRPTSRIVPVRVPCQTQTTKKNSQDYLSGQKRWKLKYLAIKFSMLLLNPWLTSPSAAASNSFKVFSVAKCVPIFWHCSRAENQFPFKVYNYID